MSKSFGHLSFGFHMPLSFGIWIFAKVELSVKISVNPWLKSFSVTSVVNYYKR
jgi:hypothetical protein